MNLVSENEGSVEEFYWFHALYKHTTMFVKKNIYEEIFFFVDSLRIFSK